MHTIWPSYLHSYMQPKMVPPIFERFVSIIKKLQHNFPKMREGSMAVWIRFGSAILPLPVCHQFQPCPRCRETPPPPPPPRSSRGWSLAGLCNLGTCPLTPPLQSSCPCQSCQRPPAELSRIEMMKMRPCLIRLLQR